MMRREMGSKSMSLPRGTSLRSSLCPTGVQTTPGMLGLATPPTPPSTSATSSSGENLDQDDLNSSAKETKRKKFHPLRAVRKIFRWGSKVKRVKCSEGVSSEGGGIIASKKSLSVGELRQASLGDPLDANMDLDAHSIDVNDHNGLGGAGGCGGTGGPGTGLYSMAGLSLSHDSVFSPDTSTPAEMGQIIHPVPVMTGISITNSLFKNELFNRVRARRAGEEDSEEDEDPGLPRSPCSHTPPNAADHPADGGLLLPCGGGMSGPDGRSSTMLGSHPGQLPLTGSIANILQHSSPGNKTKARSTCSAGSLSSMLSSETDEDSLSAGASTNQNSSGGGGGGVDKGGQISHNAARHKIAIKPKKNHGRTRPLRATPTEPSLPATPEERTTSSAADDELMSPYYSCGNNNQSLSSSAAELLDMDTSITLSTRPRSADQETATLSATPTATTQKPSPLPDYGGAPVISAASPAVELRSTIQQQQDKRRSAAALLDETPEPVVILAGSGGAGDSSPKRRPVGGVALISAQSLGGSTSRPVGSPVQRSKSMKTESVDGFRASHGDVSLGLRPCGLRPVSQASGERPDLDIDVRADGRTPLSAQNSPIKRGLSASSDFFQRSKSFSAKVSETHQALGIRRREVEKEDKDSRGSAGAGQCAFAGSGAKIGSTGERPRSELLEGVELRRPRATQRRLSPDDVSGAQSCPLQQQQPPTTSSLAGEPELFKVFARRSLKQKPGPNDEKQDVETEKDKLPLKTPKKQDSKVSSPSGDGKTGGIKCAVPHREPSPVKAGAPQIRSSVDVKRVIEPQAGQIGGDRAAQTTQTTTSNPTPIELLPNKKDLSKLKVGASVVTLREKDSSQEAGGLTSLPAMRRETDQLRKQQSFGQSPLSHQSEPLTPGAPRNLHTSTGPTHTVSGTQHSGEKRTSAVLLQRASSVAVRAAGEENAVDEDSLKSGVGATQDGSGQPEWLRLAQRKREKRELKEKMDHPSVAANNAMNAQDIGTNNKQASNQQDRTLKKLISHFSK